jgi:PAS domain S-box-containing protein
LKGNFIDGNKAAEEITGYSKSELVGKSFLKLHLLLRSQIPKAAKLLTLNAMGKPTGPDEFILNRKDRTQVQVEIRTFPTKIQDQRLVLGIARDITERKKAEKLILESQQRFAALFSNNPEATVYTDPSMHILDINPRFTSLFGYSLDEVKGKHLNDIVVPDSHMEEAKMLDSKTGEGYIYHDTVRKRKDGSLIPVSISSASISIQGQLAGIVGVYKDISEQTSSRKKLVAMNEKLRVVGGMTRHDVRNKLAAIVGNTYLVKTEMAGNEKVLGRLGEIEKAVQQSVKIFDFAKTYEMLGAEEMTFVDVGKTVKDAASLFTDLKGAKVINDCRGLDVFADSLLQQLFYNLIDNSLKYGQKMTTIRVHYEESGKNYLELVYEDDGVGIPVAGKTKLFTEGYSTGGSTGYGLYLIKKMVEVYGWTIKETGEPGKGARFLMTIPKTNERGKINYRLH